MMVVIPMPLTDVFIVDRYEHLGIELLNYASDSVGFGRKKRYAQLPDAGDRATTDALARDDFDLVFDQEIHWQAMPMIFFTALVFLLENVGLE